MKSTPNPAVHYDLTINHYFDRVRPVAEIIHPQIDINISVQDRSIVLDALN